MKMTVLLYLAWELFLRVLLAISCQLSYFFLNEAELCLSEISYSQKCWDSSLCTNKIFQIPIRELKVESQSKARQWAWDLLIRMLKIIIHHRNSKIPLVIVKVIIIIITIINRRHLKIVGIMVRIRSNQIVLREFIKIGFVKM